MEVLLKVVAYYMSGADLPIRDSQVGLALIPTALMICSDTGPEWGIILSDIQTVSLVPMKGVSMPLPSGGGFTQMTLRSDYVVQVDYRTDFEDYNLMLGMMTTLNAQRWKGDIDRACIRFNKSLGGTGHNNP